MYALKIYKEEIVKKNSKFFIFYFSKLIEINFFINKIKLINKIK